MLSRTPRPSPLTFIRGWLTLPPIARLLSFRRSSQTLAPFPATPVVGTQEWSICKHQLVSVAPVPPIGIKICHCPDSTQASDTDSYQALLMDLVSDVCTNDCSSSQLFLSVGNHAENGRFPIRASKPRRAHCAAQILMLLTYTNRQLYPRKEGIFHAKELLEID